ncbi:aminotransferase class IV [Bradyrhizobium sp. USDA 336]|uniref:aminotransferase class IV n=1 Tax=Bradyrhizobium sp. USDA 336 TaxID=3156311 RepID=UPI003832BF5B
MVEKRIASMGVKAGYPPGVAYIDGQYVSMSDAKLSILDWGFLHSDATYDVVHVWNGSFFRLHDHIARFNRGIQKLRMSLPISQDDLIEILKECVRRSGLRSAYVEMICTRGVPLPGARDPRTATNRFYAFAIPFVWIADPEKQKVGLNLAISEVLRIPESSVDPTIKNYHWLDLVKGLFEAYDRGAETAVLTDIRGTVVEGPGFNIFVVKNGRISTPKDGVLSGITRQTIIEIVREDGLPIDERAVPAHELRSADEVFISSTAGGVMPVTRIEGRPVGSGKPGSAYESVHRRYWSLHESAQFTVPVGYREAVD